MTDITAAARASDMDDFASYDIPDWDGYGAEPITAETLALARQVEAILPIPGDVVPGADGSIAWLWIKPRPSKGTVIIEVKRSGEIKIDQLVFSS